MSQNVLSRIATGLCGFNKLAYSGSLLRTGGRSLCSGALKDDDKRPLDAALLELLVCPLSKKPLRYDETTNELINEELGIAYPIIDGIPNMIPQDARLIKKKEGTEELSQS